MHLEWFVKVEQYTATCTSCLWTCVSAAQRRAKLHLTELCEAVISTQRPCTMCSTDNAHELKQPQLYQSERHLATQAVWPTTTERHLATQAVWPTTTERHLATQAVWPTTTERHLATQVVWPTTGERHLATQAVWPTTTERHLATQAVWPTMGDQRPQYAQPAHPPVQEINPLTSHLEGSAVLL